MALTKIYRILIQYEMKSSELLKFISFRSRFTHLLYWMILKEKVLNTIIADISGCVIAQITCPTPSGIDTIMQFLVYFIEFF